MHGTDIEKEMQRFSNFSEAPRIPRKKGQPAGSKKHSDLYTDENPRGTIHGLKFATVQDAKDSVKKIENSGKKHAHKVQAAVAMEQRAREMGKTAEAAVYRKYIEKMKRITKLKEYGIDVTIGGRGQAYGTMYPMADLRTEPLNAKNQMLDPVANKLNKKDRLDYLKLMNKALRTMPSSPRQKDIIKQINVFRKKVKATALPI